MKKLPVKTVNRLVEIAIAVDEIYDKMNEAHEKLLKRLEEMKEQANVLRDEAFQLLDNAACEASDYYDARSENWQESDTGRAYSDWKDRLASVRDELDSLPDIEPAVINRPEFLDSIVNETLLEPEEY